MPAMEWSAAEEGRRRGLLTRRADEEGGGQEGGEQARETPQLEVEEKSAGWVLRGAEQQ